VNIKLDIATKNTTIDQSRFIFPFSLVLEPQVLHQTKIKNKSEHKFTTPERIISLITQKKTVVNKR